MAHRFGLIGLYITATSALLFPAPANLGLLAMVLAAVARGRDFVQWLRHTPPAWLALGFAGYALLRGAAEVAVGDLAAGEAWKPLTGWALLGLSPVLAYWCAGREDRSRLLLLLCLAGLLIEALRHMDADALDNIIRLRREDFGLRLLGAPLYASIAMLGLLVFLPRIRRGLQRRLPGAWRIPPYLGLALVFAYLLLMFLLAQSRSSWVAAVVAFPVVGSGLLLTSPQRSPRQMLKALGTVFAGIAILAAVLVPWAGERLVQRAGAESATWAAIVEGRWDEVPYGSLGRRFHMTVNGLAWFGEGPVLGLGPGSVEARLAATDRLSIHEDLHNSYLDLAVELGAAGFLLLFGSLVWAGLVLVGRYRRGGVSRDLFWFLVGAVLIYLVVATMNTRLVNFDGQFSWLVLTGIILGLAYPAVPDEHATVPD